MVPPITLASTSTEAPPENATTAGAITGPVNATVMESSTLTAITPAEIDAEAVTEMLALVETSASGTLIPVAGKAVSRVEPALIEAAGVSIETEGKSTEGEAVTVTPAAISVVASIRVTNAIELSPRTVASAAVIATAVAASCTLHALVALADIWSTVTVTNEPSVLAPPD